jgi:3-dehydrosphinganine reductase
MNFFNGKLIYITGGSSGIGLEMAVQLAALGSGVILFARDRKKLEEALGLLEAKRKHAAQKFGFLCMDVRDESKVPGVINQAVTEYGVPDVVVNSAGIGHADYFENTGFDTFDSVMKINLYGTRNVIAAVLPYMKERGGSIAIVSSIAGLLGMFGYTAYGTSKFALVGFAEALRPDLKRYNIRLTLACPPETNTPLVQHEGKTIPPEARAVKNLAGLLEPDYVARKIIRGIGRRKYLVIPGFMAKTLYFLQCYMPGWIVRLSADLTSGRAGKKASKR